MILAQVTAQPNVIILGGGHVGDTGPNSFDFAFLSPRKAFTWDVASVTLSVLLVQNTDTFGELYVQLNGADVWVSEAFANGNTNNYRQTFDPNLGAIINYNNQLTIGARTSGAEVRLTTVKYTVRGERSLDIG